MYEPEEQLEDEITLSYDTSLQPMTLYNWLKLQIRLHSYL